MIETPTLDKRCRHKLRFTLPFYLYIKNRKNGIFYVRTKAGATKSTGSVCLKDALSFAKQFASQKSAQKETPHNAYCVQTVLRDYFTPESSYIQYDNIHGRRICEKTRRFFFNECQILQKLLLDVETFDDLSRQRIISLQDQLLERGISGKTANAYISVLRKITNQLADRGIIKTTPFDRIRPLTHQKQGRSCFPVPALCGVFACVREQSLPVQLAYVAITTGARRSELMRITPHEDIVCVKNRPYFLLHIRGTKSTAAKRSVPISPLTKELLFALYNAGITRSAFKKSVLEIGTRIGYTAEQIAKRGIVFHSWRKCFKTILTSCNLNQSVIEMLIGHSTHNQLSNNVERIYFVEDSAHLEPLYERVVKSFTALTTSHSG